MILFACLMSCEKDDAQGPEDYFDQGDFVITLDAQKVPGKGQYRTSLESDQTLEVGLNIQSVEEIQSLHVIKTVNLEVDESFANGGRLEIPVTGNSFDYTFLYEPSIEDVDQLVGFTFEAESAGGALSVSDLTANITLSPIDNLVTKRWGLSSIKHVNSENSPNEEVINECEEDNSFVFNADGSMSQDFGAITGVGNCSLDGLIIYDKWYISEDDKNFIMEKYNVFTPDIKEIETYRIETLSVDQLQLELTVDLTALGLGLEVFLYTFEPEPLN
jgi:hypothetical protein